MTEYKLLLVILLIHFAFCQVQEDNENIDPSVIYEPSWVYICVPEEGCHRKPESFYQNSGNSTQATGHRYYNSLHVCRTVCGRFGGLWPKPMTAALSSQLVRIHPNNLRFDLIDTPPETRDLLAKMTRVITRNLLDECDGNVTMPVGSSVVFYFTVKNANIDLTWETDEEYTLDVQTKKSKNIAVHVAAETVYGARHALETFTQLVTVEKTHNECGLLLVSGAKIKDKPVFRHRGLTLDTSRNFMPMKSIKKTIDGMAATKMNVFHWHVTDSHSFPLESPRVPQLTRYGAYSAEEIYTTEEVQELIDYARSRGIRVVIEIDSPSHAGNGWQWGPDHGLGDLAVCVNAQPWRHFCVQPPCGQLNPANPKMYEVLRNLYRDIIDLLIHPPLLHMGGDEVFLGCWNSTEEIKKYMQTKNYDFSGEGFMKLWAEFQEKALKIWDEEVESSGGLPGQPVMLWSSELTQAETISRYLDKSRYVIEVWEVLASPLQEKLLRLGYQVVAVPKDVWYLDHGFWGNTKFSNWRRMYQHILPTHNNLLGGEVAMWSEYVDEHDLDTRIWPRAAAVAERLWTNPLTGPNEAEPRLQSLRARLIARGLRPDAMSPEWCSQHAGRCL